MAGLDTTSNLMTYCSFEICRNPRVLNKLRIEIDELFSANPTGPTYENISSWRYLDSFVKETLRLHPIVPILLKKSAVNTEIFGAPIPAHSDVIVDLFGLQRDERYWGNDALEFKPERWSNDFVPVDGSYLPFGDGIFYKLILGPTNCVGYKLAMIEVKIVVAWIVREMDMELVKDQSLREFHSITLYVYSVY
jgi:cytochrome P450